MSSLDFIFLVPEGFTDAGVLDCFESHALEHIVDFLHFGDPPQSSAHGVRVVHICLHGHEPWDLVEEPDHGVDSDTE